jgi:hypothetical protein
MTSLSHIVMAEVSSKNEVFEQFQNAENLASQGQLDQAITAYKGLIKQHPRIPEAYNNLAALYLKQKNAKQAKQVLEQGLHADKGYGALYDSLTAINVALARDAYSKALQIDLKPAEVSIATLALNETETEMPAAPAAPTAVEPPAPLVSSSEHSPVIAATKTVESHPTVTPAETEKKTTEAAAVKPVEVEKKAVAAVVAKPVETEKKPVETTTVKPSADNITLETVIQAWAAAWSAQAVDMYLSFYNVQYQPDNGMSRKNWEQSRRSRLKKPAWIKVSLSNFKVEKSDSKQAVVTFTQQYKSNTYADVSSKRMVLLYTDKGWQIFKEESL